MNKKYIDVYIDKAGVKLINDELTDTFEVVEVHHDDTEKEVVWHCNKISHIYRALACIIRQTDSNCYVDVCSRIGEYEKTEIKKFIKAHHPSAEFSICGC